MDMKRNILGRALLFFLLLSAATGVWAQETKPDETPPENDRPGMNQPQDARFNLLRRLGLSREQIQRIRRMNAARRPLIEAAQVRFREANRTLDEAIYADQVNEEDVQARLKDVQLAAGRDDPHSIDGRVGREASVDAGTAREVSRLEGEI